MLDRIRTKLIPFTVSLGKGTKIDFIFTTPEKSMVVALSQQPHSKSPPVPPSKNNLSQAANTYHFKADLGKKRPLSAKESRSTRSKERVASKPRSFMIHTVQEDNHQIECNTFFLLQHSFLQSIILVLQ